MLLEVLVAKISIELCVTVWTLRPLQGLRHIRLWDKLVLQWGRSPQKLLTRSAELDACARCSTVATQEDAAKVQAATCTILVLVSIWPARPG